MTYRLVIALLALTGALAAAQLSADQWATGAACPMLGPIPACYLVLGAYLVVFASTLITGWVRQTVFLVSWLPVFVLALVASAFDLVAGPVCPRTFGGVPQCFVSLAVASAIAGVWILDLRGWHRARPFRGGAR
jgi:hypothetical protein